jgi:hypothetical protein
MVERVDYSSEEEYAQAVEYEIWAYQEWLREEEAKAKAAYLEEQGDNK